MFLAVFEGIESVCRGTIGAIAAVVEFIRKKGGRLRKDGLSRKL